MRLLLASGSPRRKEILAEIAPDFGVVPAAGEERADLSLPPSEIVCALARAKAKEVFAKFPDCAVLGADTIVWFRGRALGKPKDEGEAAATLRALSANEHEVYTGVCILAGEREECFFSRSVVRFRALDEEFIRAYVSTGSPMDKAGSYGIQDHPAPVCSYTGSFSNMVGLPKEEVREKLVSMGILQ